MSPGTGLFAPVRCPIRGIVDREDTIPLPPFPPIRCPICDTLVGREDYQGHLRSVHPAYVAWREKNARNFRNASVIVLVAVILELFLLHNSWVLPLVVAGYAVIIAITIYNMLKITRRFKRAWKDQNPEGINSNTR
jgi:hypothetical protein